MSVISFEYSQAAKFETSKLASSEISTAKISCTNELSQEATKANEIAIKNMNDVWLRHFGQKFMQID